jgi:hypothetical protein
MTPANAAKHTTYHAYAYVGGSAHPVGLAQPTAQEAEQAFRITPRELTGQYSRVEIRAQVRDGDWKILVETPICAYKIVGGNVARAAIRKAGGGE